jgi:small subunit ribosomal protein S17
MAEKTEKKTTKTATRGKTAAAPKTAAARAVKAPARAAVSARPVAKRTVARKRAVPAATAAAEQFTWRRLRRKTKVGVVVSAKMAKTIIVEVGRFREHPLYKKMIRLRKRFAAHDENGEAKAGDLVRIQESRPFSATKRWRLVEVISRAGEAGAAAPRVADVEKALEEAEGVTEILAPEREEKEEPTEEEQSQP